MACELFHYSTGMIGENIMLKQTVPPSSLDNKEQLLLASLASFRMLLVSLSFVVLFAVLFCKSIIGFCMVAFAAMNMFCEWSIRFVAQSEEVQSFFVSMMGSLP